jgi:hypothetical protein
VCVYLCCACVYESVCMCERVFVRVRLCNRVRVCVYVYSTGLKV